MSENKTNELRVLSPEENIFYDGVTIEGDGSKQGRNGKVFLHNIELGRSKNKFLNWLIAGLAIVFIGAIILFIALPALMVLVSIGLIVWLLTRFMQN